MFLNNESSDGKWNFSGGLEVRLLESMSKHFNFTYRIINCNSDWGVLLKNNTWTGIVGKVASKVYHFSNIRKYLSFKKRSNRRISIRIMK